MEKGILIVFDDDSTAEFDLTELTDIERSKITKALQVLYNILYNTKADIDLD